MTPRLEPYPQAWRRIEPVHSYCTGCAICGLAGSLLRWNMPKGAARLASRGNHLSSSKSESVGVTPGRDGTPVPPDIALFRRERELALLEAAVERAWSGRGSLIVCTGPAGSGRSKILSVGAERAEQAGMRVLSATGRSAERDLDFGAALQLLRGRGLASRCRGTGATAVRSGRTGGPAAHSRPARAELDRADILDSSWAPPPMRSPRPGRPTRARGR